MLAASADHVKALVRAHAAGDEEGFYAVALQMAAKAARQGHNRLAAELRDLIDRAKAEQVPQVGPTPVIRPKGELAELVTAEYPQVRLRDMTLSKTVRAALQRILHEQRQRARLESYGFEPIHRVLLVGPPGTGKSMTGAALAGELGLPLFTVRLDGLISRFMGETAAKLRIIFEATKKTRAVYLFDEFDAIGAERTAANDVGEARRILNSFLLFLDETRPESPVIAATNHPQLLDRALFRRFDSVIAYDLPDRGQAKEVLRRRLQMMDTTEVDWSAAESHSAGLSHAELVRAAESAAKDAILRGEEAVSTAALIAALNERASARRE
ncbi:AAA family ATPase [Thermomonospora curvata]|uniref:AAA ATPase central domain protein n=1 Tax=Thermomonospora curvata (strain ATCC 19995 / DSM 43183 / JCM 3096 / KCTC 9072 / NBRC 15933 / NCIMB 10081 / Henssen B9) TaxID=471852 RepID=D1A894_THECD|nr:ATP-binding protein [Thermomonospora curvata]ACZ00409.1 AAA ATPase central domain protein [Thermomonospora curvata DSM 43183]